MVMIGMLGRLLAPVRLAGLLLAAACVPVSPPETPSPGPASQAPAPSAESLTLARYYAGVETRLLARGLLRQDGGGPDTPFTAEDLARNFLRIAFYDEYSLVGGRYVARERKSRLRRWERPVRFFLHFDPTLPPDTRREIIAEIDAFVRRLARITGRDMRLLRRGRGNFLVAVVTVDTLRRARSWLPRLLGPVDEVTLGEIVRMPRETFCAAYAFSDQPDSSAYTHAVAIIRAEHPPLMRRSCIHEELAQGLGLANDSPEARPSIFNDDEEFALLTRMDELMLRMLYDPRLKVGMTVEEARPVVESIARELLSERLATLVDTPR